MIWWLHITWLVVALYSLTHQRPDWSAFDVRRCYASHQRLYCWPKDGCWFAEDRAICWRVVTVKPQ